MKHQVRTQPTEDKSVCKNCYPYSNHVQILGQIGLFRVALSLGFKPARLRTTKTPQAPSPTAAPSSWGEGFFLSPA